VDWFAERTGVVAAPGGAHPTGTANALVALTVDGRRGPQYIELIGPNPDRSEPELPETFGISTLTAPSVQAYAVHPADIEATVATARAGGYDPGDVSDLSRRTPDGTLLEWRLTRGEHRRIDVPFLIDWGTTAARAQRHPDDRARLARAHRARPGAAAQILAAFGLGDGVAEVVAGDAAGFRLTLPRRRRSRRAVSVEAAPSPAAADARSRPPSSACAPTSPGSPASCTTSPRSASKSMRPSRASRRSSPRTAWMPRSVRSGSTRLCGRRRGGCRGIRPALRDHRGVRRPAGHRHACGHNIIAASRSGRSSRPRRSVAGSVGGCRSSAPPRRRTAAARSSSSAPAGSTTWMPPAWSTPRADRARVPSSASARRECAASR
jgi:hypothetical protein